MAEYKTNTNCKDNKTAGAESPSQIGNTNGNEKVMIMLNKIQAIAIKDKEIINLLTFVLSQS